MLRNPAARPRLAGMVLTLSAVLASGCSEDGSSSFQEIEPQYKPVATFDRQSFEGGDVRAYFFDMTSDMISPELIANWTVINSQTYIDMYVMPAADYDPAKTPPNQSNIFWTSVPSVGPLYGDTRLTAITLHPCVYNTAVPPQCRPEGRWVVLFHNNNLRNPANRVQVSATVQVRFFQ